MAIYERIAAERESSVVQLTRGAGVSQPAVSQHLKVLVSAGLIAGRRCGRQTFYHAKPGGLLPLAGWMKQHERFWQQRFDRLDDYLQQLQKSEGSNDDE